MLTKNHKLQLYCLGEGTFLRKGKKESKISDESCSHLALSPFNLYAAATKNKLIIKSLISSHSAAIVLNHIVQGLLWCGSLVVVSTLESTLVLSKDAEILRKLESGVVASDSYLWPTLFIWNGSLQVYVLPYLSIGDESKFDLIRDGSFWTEKLVDHYEAQVASRKGIVYPTEGNCPRIGRTLG